MSALESAFLWMETERAPLHVGCLLLFDGSPPDLSDLADRMADRVADRPALRAGVRFPRGRRPAWDIHASIDLTHHLQRAEPSERGDRSALASLVSRLMADRLAPSRPLWKVWLIDGCPDGQWGLLVKAHHTLVDGQSGSDLLACLLDTTEEVDRGESPADGHAAARTRSLRASARDLRAGIRTLARPDLPATVLNGPLSADRGWAWAGFDRAQLQSAARARDCTVNDLFLAALAGAVRSVLLRETASLTECVVRTIVPVSQRTPGEQIRRGTIASAMFVELPVQEADPRARLTTVMNRSARQKGAEVARGTEAVLHAADHVPSVVLARASRAYVRHGQQRVNAAASNVRGAEGAFQLMGRPLRAAVPWIPVALDVRLTSAMLSFGPTTCISISTDAQAIPDVDMVMEVLARDLTELMSSSPPGPAVL